MARASYIYLVCPRGSNSVLAAFTVKYEAQDWAEDWAERQGKDLGDLERFRVRDGGHINCRHGRNEATDQSACPWES